MTNQVLGSVRSRKRWKKLIDTTIKLLLECEYGTERQVVMTIEWPHFYKRPEWLPEGKRKKLLDKSAVFAYNASKLLSAAYEANLTDTSVKDITKLKRDFSLQEHEDELDKLLEVDIGNKEI